MENRIKEYGPNEIAEMLKPMLYREGRLSYLFLDITSIVMTFMDVKSNQAEDVLELLTGQGYLFHSNAYDEKTDYALTDKGIDLIMRYAKNLEMYKLQGNWSVRKWQNLAQKHEVANGVKRNE